MTTSQDILGRLNDEDIHSVRIVFVDQHGLLKGKTIAAAAMPSALDNGIGVPGSLLHKDIGNEYAVALWQTTGDETLDALVGARNILMRPDPSTFVVLPWVAGTAMMLSDLETGDGRAIPHATRRMCADALDRLHGRGLQLAAGLELEFHLFRSGPDGELSHSHPGWDLLGEDGLDRIEPAIEPIRLGLSAMGMAPSTIEAELGPSQIEMTFAPQLGLDIADQTVLIRNAIKHIARRNGHYASFMSRPSLGNEAGFPSGWHVHQSLVAIDDSDRRSLFAPEVGRESWLSPLGGNWVAGLLANAAASCLLTTPTVTGYKRYRPRAVTPDRISWSHEHRGAMLRVVGQGGDPATRIENRAGDPAANPYLLVASQLVSGLDGIENEMVPPDPTETPYEPEGGDHLPRTLGDAIDAFAASGTFRKAFGDDIVDYLVALKRSEWNRFCRTVTDWEHREYFDRY